MALPAQDPVYYTHTLVDETVVVNEVPQAEVKPTLGKVFAVVRVQGLIASAWLFVVSHPLSRQTVSGV